MIIDLLRNNSKPRRGDINTGKSCHPFGSTLIFALFYNSFICFDRLNTPPSGLPLRKVS